MCLLFNWDWGLCVYFLQITYIFICVLYARRQNLLLCAIFILYTWTLFSLLTFHIQFNAQHRIYFIFWLLLCIYAETLVNSSNKNWWIILFRWLNFATAISSKQMMLMESIWVPMFWMKSSKTWYLSEWMCELVNDHCSSVKKGERDRKKKTIKTLRIEQKVQVHWKV